MTSIATRVVAVGLALYVGTVLVLFPKWTVDDAYILFRYARNLVEAGRLTWNPGEHPIEGYTGIALVLLVAGAVKLGLSPIVTSQMIGAASFLLGGVVLFHFLGRLSVARPVRSVVLLLYFAAPLFVTNAFSGLETVLFSTVTLSSLFVLHSCLVAPSPRPSREVGLLALLLLDGLVRPEGALFGGLCFAGLALVKGRTAPADLRSFLVRGLLVYVVPGLGYFFWRWSYYGLLLPNTFYAKTFESGLLNPTTLADLRQFAMSYLLLPLAGAVLWAVADADVAWSRLRQRDGGRALVVSGVVTAIFVASCSIVYARSWLVMNFSHRFFLPFFPLLLVFVSVLVDAGFRSVRDARAEKPLRFRGLQALSVFLIVVQLVMYARELRGDVAYASRYQRLMEGQHIAAGKFIRSRVAPSEWLVVVYDAGAIPYYSELPTVDFGQLNNPTVARLARSGNSRALVDYFFSHRAGVAVFTSSDRDRVNHHGNPLTAEIVGDERFGHYVFVRRFSNDIRNYHQFVFFRKDLAPPHR